MASIPKDPYAKPALIGGLVVLGATAFVLLSNLFNTIEKNSVKGAEDTSMFAAAAADNLKKVGTVVAVDKSIAPKARTGEEVFNAVCTACHTGGVLGAPKLEKAAWDARVAKGLQGLVTSATNGINQMPARGGDPTITDQELTDAILYMTSKSGHDLSAQQGGGATPAAAPVAAQPAAQAAPAAATAPATEPATPTQQQPTPAAAATPAAPTAPAPADAQPAAAKVAGIDGQKIYKGICFSCHDVGVANSPKLGDKAAWSTRVAQGADTLYNHAINGFNAMPPRGGNPALSDDEIKAAVDWMVAQ